MSENGQHAGMHHRHGDTSAIRAGRHIADRRDVLKFSVNVNPLGIPDEIRNAWPDLLDSIRHYPTPDGNGIIQYYTEKYRISPDTILSGNGSVELMYRCFAALRFRRVAVICPSFFDYENAVQVSGATVERLNLRADEGFKSPSLQQLSEALERNDALIVGNPNNPTGTLFDYRLLTELAQSHPQKTLLVDEAFLPFVSDELAYSFLASTTWIPNVIVFHSLTKIFAIPGIRAGAMIAAPCIISRVCNVSPPWMCNSIADRVAPMLLQCDNYIQDTRLLVHREMARMISYMDSIESVSLIRSEVNFALVQVADEGRLVWVIHQLARQGIEVRDCRNFAGLSKHFFRFGLRMPEDNQRLINALIELDNG